LDTQEKEGRVFRFIVLIPHQDAILPFAQYRRELFAAGFHGAYSFPLSSPLAEVLKPLCKEELKELARNIREKTKEDGKIQSGLTAEAIFSEATSFFGPQINLASGLSLFPPSAKTKILRCFGEPILCAALIDSKSPSGEANPILPKPPTVSFRAASVANLVIRPLFPPATPDFSFEWKIGPGIWLPKFCHKPHEQNKK